MPDCVLPIFNPYCWTILANYAEFWCWTAIFDCSELYCITLLSSMYFWAMILYFPVEPFYSLFATVSSCQKVGTAKSTRAQLAPAYTNLSRQSWLPFLSFCSFIFCLDASLKSSHQYFWLNAGIRACGDLPPWSPPHRRSSRSWRLLYHPLRRRLWEDWHEDDDLWDPSSRGGHFQARTFQSSISLQILTKDSVTVFVNAIMYYKVKLSQTQ